MRIVRAPAAFEAVSLPSGAWLWVWTAGTRSAQTFKPILSSAEG